MNEADAAAANKAKFGKNRVEVKNLLYHGNPIIRAQACANECLSEQEIICAIDDVNPIVRAQVARRTTQQSIIRFLERPPRKIRERLKTARQPIWSHEADAKVLSDEIARAKIRLGMN